jgi:hypothetical protein
MAIETFFMGGGSLRSLSIPVSECTQAPFSLNPDIPQEIIDKTSNKIRSLYEPAGDVIVRPLAGGVYEVLCGWHEIVLWKAIHPDKHMPVKSGNLNDMEAIAVSIRVTYESHSLQCTKLWLSRALIKAKSHFNMTDKALSEALGSGYSRSAINNLVNFSRLSPETEEAFLAGKVKAHQLKHLCTLSFTEQASHIETLLSKPISTPSVSAPEKPAEEYSEDQDIDTKRFSRDLSEKLGAPCTILLGPDKKQRLRIDFHDFFELGGIADKLVSSTSPIKGRLVFDMANSDGFTPITDALFSDEF